MAQVYSKVLAHFIDSSFKQELRHDTRNRHRNLCVSLGTLNDLNILRLYLRRFKTQVSFLNIEFVDNYFRPTSRSKGECGAYCSRMTPSHHVVERFLLSLKVEVHFVVRLWHKCHVTINGFLADNFG